MISRWQLHKVRGYLMLLRSFESFAILQKNTNIMEWKKNGNKMECCGKKFLTSQVFEMHKQVKHRGLCSKTENPDLKIVTVNKAKLCCPQCSFTAKNLRTLSWHLSQHHNNEKMICNFCGAMLGSKHALNVHVKQVHTGVKMPCPKCPFST